MNPFKTTGFDNLIGKGLVINASEIMLPAGSTMIVDGQVTVEKIMMIVDQQPGGLLDKIMPGPDHKKTTLVTNGQVTANGDVNVSNMTITGQFNAKVLICEGMLAIKSGAKVEATEIRYRSLTIEDGAIVLGKMTHLDHVNGEV